MTLSERRQSRIWCEGKRLSELARYRILDTMQETSFDRIVSLACVLFDTPMAAITLVDKDRQWFKARVGLTATQTSRADSFCSHVVAIDDVLVVADARLDRRFAANPLVTGNPQIRFYAGAPIRSSQHVNIGALCVISDRPRHDFSPADQRALHMLATLVQSELELRLGAQLVETSTIAATSGAHSLPGAAAVNFVEHSHQ